MRKQRKNNMKGSTKSWTKFCTWSDLPNDLLLNIFSRVDPKDLFWFISSVCRSWQLACWDVLFWQGEVLHLGNMMSLCDTDVVEDRFDKIGLALTKVMKSLFSYNGDLLEDMHKKRVYYMMFSLVVLSDRHLVYVAERTAKLQSVSLNISGITGKGFSRAIRKWRELKAIAIGSPSDDHYTHVIQEMGINCGKLQVLGLHSISTIFRSWFRLDEYNSQVIANSLQNLKGLILADCYIYKLGLQTIMSKCRQLVVIDITTARRGLEEVKLTRRKRALDTQPFRFIPELLTVRLNKSVNSEEWIIGDVAEKYNIVSVINHLWMETGEENIMPRE